MIYIFVCSACTEATCYHMIESNLDMTAPRIPTECPYCVGRSNFKETGVQ